MNTSFKINSKKHLRKLKAKMEHKKFFAYSWHVDEDEEEITSIRIYGIDETNKNVCVRVDNFTPYVYIELPERIRWDAGKAQLVGNKLDELLGRQKPLKKVLMMKKRLYGAHLDKKRNRKLFPYLFCSFSARKDIKSLGYRLRRTLHVVGIGAIKLKMHEADADEILQLTCCRQIPTAGWIDFHGKRQEEDDKLTLCDDEFKVKWKHLSPLKSDEVANPKIMGFDIEVNSTNPSAMPNANKPGDKIFQISCVISRYGDSKEEYEKYLLTLGHPDPETVGDDVLIYMYDTESDLLEGFTNFIREENPNIIVGYNILGFDIPYMIDRAKFNMCIFNFDQQGFHKFAHARERTIKWSSSAYKNQEFQFLDAEGRVYVDLLPLVKRDFKFSNYKLKTISEHFIGQSKDDLSPKGIFKCYRIGIKKNKKGEYGAKAQRAMAICGKYCVKDSELVILLMDKLQTWVGLTEMAKTCCVPIFTLYTQGQQIKVYSQLYKHCMYENIVVEKDGYQVSEGERYVGAHVFPPVPGRYKKVVPFDFASLYPTTIIAYNIDYHTWVPDDSDIPDSECHVMEWEDHVSCQHDPKIIRKVELDKYIDSEREAIKKMREKRNKTMDKLRKKEMMADINTKVEELKPYVKERSDINKTKSKFPMCAKRYYRFLKEPRGVLPTVIQNLLDARAHTRKVDIVKCKDKIRELEADGDDHNKEIEALNGMIGVLNKRQLAYKVSANSMYGAAGVRRGYLPCMPVAMCTTYMGRVNIELTAETIVNKFGGHLVYGDTDCLTGETPVLLKWTDPREPSRTKLCYKTMETISAGNWTRINPNKEISNPLPGYQIWSDQGFTDIVNVVRCGVVKPLSRVVVHTGEVTCSNEHSLLREDLSSATPLDIKLKDPLCITELPLPDDTPVEPKYPNNLTTEVIRNYKISSDILYKDGFSAELAFVWGMFFADGSCGTHIQKKKYTMSTWAINKRDKTLLERCMDILKRHETSMDFKILDTVKSSHVYKLIAVQHSKKLEHKGDIKNFVEKYRELFYDERKYKKIPDLIFNLPLAFREAFFMGYYAGDGSKKDPALTITNKGAIGSAGIFFLLRSLGYKVSINTRKDKLDIYKLTGSSPEQKFRYKPNVVKKIIPVQQDAHQYIYDIQTENHHFAAGVGQLVVHNSNYINFPHMEGKSDEELWAYSEYVADEVTKLFPPPMKLEFEGEIYTFFFILTKKRYMYRKVVKKGDKMVYSNSIGKKGVLLARRDNSKFVRDIYEGVVNRIADDVSRDDILYWILQEIDAMFAGCKPYTDFVVTKSVGSSGELQAETFVNEKGVKKAKVGDYTVPILSSNKNEREEQLVKKGAENAQDYYLLCLPAQVQLAERMRRRGQRVDAGTRLEYVVANPESHTSKQYEKVESADYYAKHSDVIKMDYYYYLKALSNPVDQILNVAFGKDDDWKEDFVLNQYKFRWKSRHKLILELKELFSPVVRFIE
jgi:DNA polymerase elongation subunit (family B)